MKRGTSGADDSWMTAKAKATGTFPQLDGLRGLGALTFFTFHFLTSLPDNGVPVPPAVAELSTNITVLFLHVFFAVSGLILFGSLERLREESGGRPNGVMLAFYTRRFFRIIPLWWAVLTIELFRQHLDLDVYLANATFAFGFLFFDARFLPIGVAWTLFVEELFYALVPGIFRWIRGVASSLVLLATLMLVARIWNQQAESLGIPAANRFIEDFPLEYFKYFAIGILVRFLYPRISPRWAPALDLAAIAGVAVTAFALRAATPAVFLLLLAVLVPGSRLARWITLAPLTFIGVHCYFVYITHDQLFVDPVVIGMLPKLLASPLGATGAAIPVAVTFGIAFGGCLLAAYGSMRLFEGPLIKLGKRLSVRVLRSRASSVEPASDASPRTSASTSDPARAGS